MRTSLVIPARNEQDYILDTVDAAARALHALGEPFEVIVADDGSTDRTKDILDAARADRAWLIVDHHRPGQGKGGALDRGFRIARGSTIAFIDADMQIPTADVRQLLISARTRPNEVTVGVRAGRRMPPSRQFVSLAYRGLVRTLLGLQSRDPGCPLKIFPAELTQKRPLLVKGWVVDAELLMRARHARMPVVEVQVRTNPDKSMRSRLKASDIAACIRDLWLLRRRDLKGQEKSGYVSS